MNIRNNSAGCVDESHILRSGFWVYNHINIPDIGTEWTIAQYTDGVITITGGYWTWIISNSKGEKIWDGWWNSNEEFDKTIKLIRNEPNKIPD